MASPQEAIYGRLNSRSGVTAHTSNRIYPHVVPQNAKLPAVVYFQVSDPREHAFLGDPNIAHPRFQVSCFSTSYSQLRALSKQVRYALQDYTGTTWCNVKRMFFDDETELSDIDPEGKTVTYQAAQDYIIWWST